MKVRITDLPADGLIINDFLDLEPLCARLADDGKSIFTLLDPPSVAIKVSPLGQDGAQVSGFITASYKQDCALCLEPAPRGAKLPVEFQIRIKPSTDFENNDFEDDIGMVFVQEETVALDETLEEIFILSLDLFWHPPFTAGNGTERCSICNKTRKELGVLSDGPKTTLGDLLKLSSGRG